jgi:hypothetical protein
LLGRAGGHGLAVIDVLLLQRVAHIHVAFGLIEALFQCIREGRAID